MSLSLACEATTSLTCLLLASFQAFLAFFLAAEWLFLSKGEAVI